MTTAVQVRHPGWLSPLFMSNPLPRYVLLPGGRGRGATMGVAAYCVEQMLLGRNILCLREYQNSIMDSNLAIMKKVVRDMGLESQFDLTLRQELRCTRSGAWTSFRGCSRDLESIKSISGYSVVWFEEAEALSEDSIHILMPSFREENQVILCTWNPRYEDDPIEQYRRGLLPHEALELRATFADNPFFPDELETERQICLRQMPDRYGWIWEGQFRPEAANNPFGADLIRYAFEKRYEFDDRSGDSVVGVDLAYTDTPSSDYTALVKLDLNGNQLDVLRFKEANDYERLKKVAAFCRGAFYILVDATDGRGGVLAADLQQINSGTRFKQFTRRFKQQLVGGLAERLARGGLALRNEDMKLEMLDYAEDDRGGFGGIRLHDDLVTALMLANAILDEKERRVDLDNF